jgi:hypothetical protein
MRGKSISNQIFSGTTRWQEEDEIGHDDLAHDISYAELLQCQRRDYERMSVPKKKAAPVVKAVEPMAEISWHDARPMADRLKDTSEAAFRLEMLRRGYETVGKILATQQKSK